MVELLKYEVRSLLWYLHNKALRSFNVEGSDVHHCFARADFNYVVASAHALTFLIKHDAVLIQNACYSVDHSSRLVELLRHISAELRRNATTIHANIRMAHHRRFKARIIA